MIELTEQMQQAINNSLEDGNPVIFSSAGADGQPRLGFVGSIYSFSADQFAIWLRKADSTSADNIRSNPHLAFLYRNPAERLMWQFQGRGHIVEDAALREQVYHAIPERERNFDQEMLGQAVVIDIDRVLERGAAIQEREPANER